MAALRPAWRPPYVLADQRATRAFLVVDTKPLAGVPAEIELGQIPMQMSLAHMLVHAVNPALQDREIALDGVGIDELEDLGENMVRTVSNFYFDFERVFSSFGIPPQMLKETVEKKATIRNDLLVRVKFPSLNEEDEIRRF